MLPFLTLEHTSYFHLQILTVPPCFFHGINLQGFALGTEETFTDVASLFVHLGHRFVQTCSRSQLKDFMPDFVASAVNDGLRCYDGK